MGLCRRKGEGNVDTAEREWEARASPATGPKEHTSTPGTSWDNSLLLKGTDRSVITAW